MKLRTMSTLKTLRHKVHDKHMFYVSYTFKHSRTFGLGPLQQDGFYWLISRAQGWDLGTIFERLKNRSCWWRMQST